MTLLPKPVHAEKRAVRPLRRGPGPKRKKPLNRTTRVKKYSLRDLPKLRKKLWDLFAAYVKERDGNVCFTCDKPGLEGSGWHAGHMVKRTRASVCYDPSNVHSQCAGCNLALDGNGAVYALRHMDKYGAAKTQAVLARAKELRQWKPFEIAELIEALKRGGADFELLYESKYGCVVELPRCSRCWGFVPELEPHDCVPMSSDVVEAAR